MPVSMILFLASFVATITGCSMMLNGPNTYAEAVLVTGVVGVMGYAISTLASFNNQVGDDHHDNQYTDELESYDRFLMIIGIVVTLFFQAVALMWTVGVT